jgi:hypothetical protein
MASVTDAEILEVSDREDRRNSPLKGLSGRAVAEIAARRAVADVGEEIIALGGTSDQADAYEAALRYWLLGDTAKAREILIRAFPNGTTDDILAEFAHGAQAA